MATYEFVCRECETAFEVTCHMDQREDAGGLPEVREP